MAWDNPVNKIVLGPELLMEMDQEVAKIFMKEIFKLHGLPKEIVVDRDAKFTSNFWKVLFVYLGTKLNFNTAYHPQANGQIERVNQVLEDMLRMYVMEKPTKWEDYLWTASFLGDESI